MSADPEESAARRYGRWVVEQMMAKGWNQARLAAETGIAPSLIASIRAGTAVKPSPSQVAKIADVFDTDPNHVFRVAGWWESKDLPPDRLNTLEREVVAILRALSPRAQIVAVTQVRALLELNA
jgi:transcriptional regulator with XRE-family HTH domain